MKGLVQNLIPDLVGSVRKELSGYERVLFDKMVEHGKDDKRIDFGIIRGELGWSEMFMYNVKINLKRELAEAHKKLYVPDSFYYENIWTRS